MRLLNAQVFLIINAISAAFIFAHNCLLDNRNYKCRIGTKTPYRFISNHDDSPLEYPGFNPVFNSIQ